MNLYIHMRKHIHGMYISTNSTEWKKILSERQFSHAACRIKFKEREKLDLYRIFGFLSDIV